MQKAKDTYCKKEAGEYYLKNKVAITEKSKSRCKNFPNVEKDKIKEYHRKRYQQLIQFNNKALRLR